MFIANPDAPAITSYLNNDNIDQLTPVPRRKRVSSISLSDQFAGSFSNMSQLDKESSGRTLLSSPLAVPRLSFGNVSLNAVAPKFKKSIIDHPRVSSYAFAFDIDGVLIRGPETLSYGVEAIKYLEGNNPYNIKVPYIFVTNGGGKHESVRAEDLSARLKTDITVDQIVQGHTPMKDLSNTYKNVLVVGGVGNTCRDVAESYGFEKVFTPFDIMKWDPSVTPYYELSEEDKTYSKYGDNTDFSQTKIDAIMVFADSRNWAVDQQIILELLMSKDGRMGTISETFEDGPPIYFAHSDFIWATNYKLVRYGMGALQVSIAALFREHTGKEMKVIRFGKPQRSTFKYAEKVLHSWRKSILDDHIDEMTSSSDGRTQTSDIFSNDDYQDGVEAIVGVDGYRPVFNNSDSESEEKEDEDLDGSQDALTFQSLNKLSLSQSFKTAKVKERTCSIKTETFSSTENLPPPSTVYFVGDTPESDIRFANSHDEAWFSILVNTGVYQSGTVPKYKPKKQCDNVLEAVKFAVEREHQKELSEWNNSALDMLN